MDKAALERVIENENILTALKYAGVILEVAASAVPYLQHVLPLFQAIQNAKDMKAVEKEVQGTMRRLEEVSTAIQSCRQQLEMSEVNFKLSDLQKKLQYQLNALETLIKADPKDEEAVQKFKATFLQYGGEGNLRSLHREIMQDEDFFGNPVLKVYKTHCDPEEKKQGCLHLIRMFYNLMIIVIVYQTICGSTSEAIQDAWNEKVVEFNKKIKEEMAEDTSPQSSE